IADLQAPHAAGYAGVDEADAVLTQLRRVHFVVGVLRVTAVDNDVTGLEKTTELFDGLPRRLTRGDHDPDLAWRAQLRDQILERLGVADLLIAVVAHDRETALAHALAHEPAHLAKTDQTDLEAGFRHANLRVQVLDLRVVNLRAAVISQTVGPASADTGSRRPKTRQLPCCHEGPRAWSAT